MGQELFTALFCVRLHREAAPQIVMGQIAISRVEHDTSILTPLWMLEPGARCGNPLISDLHFFVCVPKTEVLGLHELRLVGLFVEKNEDLPAHQHYGVVSIEAPYVGLA